MVVFGEVHHLLIDIQPVNPRRSSTFLFLVPNQRSIKVARPSSVRPLLVKGKADVLFSWKSVNMVSDVDFISMSRNGQLTGFCHALPKTESRDLRVTDSKYRESLDRFEKSKTLKLCLKNAFREFSSKILFRFSKNLTSSRNSQKTKIHLLPHEICKEYKEN